MRAEIETAAGEILDCGEVLIAKDGTAALGVFNLNGVLSDEERARLTRDYANAYPGRAIVVVGIGDMWQLVKSAGQGGASSQGFTIHEARE